jgi:hypothetical protein
MLSITNVSYSGSNQPGGQVEVAIAVSNDGADEIVTVTGSPPEMQGHSGGQDNVALGPSLPYAVFTLGPFAMPAGDARITVRLWRWAMGPYAMDWFEVVAMLVVVPGVQVPATQYGIVDSGFSRKAR